ncbi:MAG TPA: hypothetical protein VFE62_00715 [Gemmataceae bacterium]|nr:hypothetical protein [Gemmataceae bacterium]
MSDLIDYRTAAHEHGKHTMSGDSDLANQAFEALQSAFNRLVAAKHDAMICDLYEDPDPWVQLWAAAHTLEITESKALEKLTNLRDARKPVLSMNAKFTIVEWKNHRLAFRHVPESS